MQNKEFPRLRECPFCGEHPKRHELFGNWYVACENEKCLIQPMTPAYKSKGAEVRVWNRRAGDGNG